MAWQQPEFKFHQKLLAQAEKNYVRKENNKPWKTERKVERSVVAGDDSRIFHKFEWLYAQVFANDNKK